MRTALLALALLASGCSDDPAVVDRDTDVVVTDGAETSTTDVADGDAVQVAAPDADAPAMPAADAPAAAPSAAPASAAPARTSSAAKAGAGDAARRSFPDFPAPFSIVVPDGATVEQPGSGDAVVIENGSSSVTVGVALGETPEAALARIRAAVPGGIETRPLAAGWTPHAFEYTMASQGPSFFETVQVGQHDGTTVVVETSRSDEGEPPIVDAVLGSWQWADRTPLR